MIKSGDMVRNNDPRRRKDVMVEDVNLVNGTFTYTTKEKMGGVHVGMVTKKHSVKLKFVKEDGVMTYKRGWSLLTKAID